MKMLQDARQTGHTLKFQFQDETYDLHGVVHYAVFTQKPQKRTVVQQGYPDKFHFIGLPELALSFKYTRLGEILQLHSLHVAAIKDGKLDEPLCVPLYNVSYCGFACLGRDAQTDFADLPELTQRTADSFWNSKFTGDDFRTARTLAKNTPFGTFETWAEYTRKHPDTVPEFEIPLPNHSKKWFTPRPQTHLTVI